MEELLSDAERRRILGLLVDAMPREGRDRQLAQIIKKLSGPDVELVVLRNHPIGQKVSRGVVIDPPRQTADNE